MCNHNGDSYDEHVRECGETEIDPVAERTVAAREKFWQALAERSPEQVKADRQQWIDEQDFWWRAILHERGWNDRAIYTILGRPDFERERTQRRYKMLMWRKDRVLKAELTEEFAELKRKPRRKRPLSLVQNK